MDQKKTPYLVTFHAVVMINVRELIAGITH